MSNAGKDWSWNIFTSGDLSCLFVQGLFLLLLFKVLIDVWILFQVSFRSSKIIATKHGGIILYNCVNTLYVISESFQQRLVFRELIYLHPACNSPKVSHYLLSYSFSGTLELHSQLLGCSLCKSPLLFSQDEPHRLPK